MVRQAIEDPDNVYYPYIRHLVNDVDHDVLTMLAVNLFINASLVGWDVQEEARKKYNCNIPWAILLDPASACNLHCTGCWAAHRPCCRILSSGRPSTIVSGSCGP